MYAKLAIMGLKRRKGRTFFTALAIAISVSMAVLLVSVGVSLKQGTSMMYEKDVDYWIIPMDSSVTDIVSNSERTMLGDVHRSLEKINANPDIKYATPVLNRLIYASTGKATKSILGVGAIPGNDEELLIPTHGLTPGDPRFSKGAGTGEILINEKTSRLFGLKQGDKLRLGVSSSNINNSFRVMGIITEVEYSISPVVVLHLSELQELTGNLKEDRANYIVATGSNALDYLAGLFPGTVVLSSYEYSMYNVVGDKKLLATAFAVSIVSLFIAVLFISNAMIMSVNEKQQEFALMRAIGIKPRSIAKMVFYESLFLSLFGAILGILLSGFGQYLLNTLAYRYFEAEHVSVIDPMLQLGGIGIMLGAGIFSALIPVLMIKRIDIVGTLGGL
ncbi:MAG: FtsX-like permease family protein [Candidatus Methanoperedens sp.]|nr:FtsX-like permease family protein [Candidatus Methanoperedens sp.]MCZ7360999.1 FtsX-like permease family protein [Candidatus Methanoperedens sp.]HLB69886.1 FtsX-like permease family protein [Candidatus Methanoperedens sp.]